MVRSLCMHANGKWILKTLLTISINLFSNQYPKSKWWDDVQELRIQLTNQVPPRTEAIFLAAFPNVPVLPPPPAAPPAFAGQQVFASHVNASVNGPQPVFAFQFQG